MMTVSEQINALLPQTQCGQCSYKGCRPYAEAIADGQADINQCPPGGDEGIHALAAFLDVPFKPLNPAFGVHKPRQVAFIIEQDCIGCVKCLAACPVDAIIGAAKFMHTVIADECTGCELCVAPCPVDCHCDTKTDCSRMSAGKNMSLSAKSISSDLSAFRCCRTLASGGALFMKSCKFSTS
jgi:electron transport complex protein RnfB